MTALTPRPGIMKIAPYVPGKDSVDGKEPIAKLSSNESALGPSPKAMAAYTKAAAELHRYPDGGAEKLHTDERGTLWRKPVPNDEALVMVEVLNSTPEPDGSIKTYFLPCHPELRPNPVPANGMRMGEPQKLTASNAIASTFGLRGEQYAPAQET